MLSSLVLDRLFYIWMNSIIAGLHWTSYSDFPFFYGKPWMYASCSCWLIFKSTCFSLSCLLTFVDIPDQCSPSPCNPKGTVRCEDKKGDFLCHCFTGWAGASCEKGNAITEESERGYMACEHRAMELSRDHMSFISNMGPIQELDTCHHQCDLGSDRSW